MNNEDMIAAQSAAAALVASQALALAVMIMKGFGESPEALLDGVAADGAANLAQWEADGEGPERQAALIALAQTAYAELIAGVRAQCG